MARKKITKKDLDKGVARLKKKLETTSSRLKKQKSDHSRKLSALQKQLEELRRNDRLSKKLKSQGKQQKDLALSAQALETRLRDLEETTSLVERAGEELKGRTEALERTAAEFSVWQRGCTQLTRRLDDQSGTLPAMKERLDRLTLDLNKLWAGADGMGVSFDQHKSIVTLLGKSRDELVDRTGVLETGLKDLSERQAQIEDRLSQASGLTLDWPAEGAADDLVERLDALDGRHQDQARLVADCDLRLHDVEQVCYRLERTSDELLTRTESLESDAANAKRDRDDLLRRTSELEGHIEGLPVLQARIDGLQSRLDAAPDAQRRPDSGHQPAVIDALGDRTRVVEEQLRRLSAAQENLELQTALLSRQAEGGAETPQGVGDFPGSQPETLQSPEELAARIRELQEATHRQARDSVELAAHLERVEKAGATLSEIQQKLQGRVGLVEQRVAAPQSVAAAAQPEELLRTVPKLLDRCSMTEEATARLNRRTAVLEARGESLARGHTQLTVELEAVQRRLSLFQEPQSHHPAQGLTRSLAPAQPAAPPNGVLESLEQQLVSLTADHSANRANVEDLLGRTRALENSTTRQTEQSEALSGRLATLADQMQGLLALRLEQRLDDLDLRGDTLERSLQVERRRIDDLLQSDGTREQRLSAVVENTGKLDGLVATLSSGSQRLGDALERLGGDVEAARRRADQQQEQIQAHETRLAEQQRRFEEAVGGHQKVSDGLKDHLATLGEKQQALREATSSLGLEQTRQSNETQNLQRKVNQRSTVGALMLLLVAVAVGFALMRDPVIPQAPQQVARALAQPVPASVTAAEFEKEIADVRLELSRLDGAVAEVNETVAQVNDTVVKVNGTVAQVSGSVERLDRAVVPQLPAQLSDLARSVESLGQENLRQRQENARLLDVQQRLQTDVEQLSGTVRSLEKQVADYPTIEAAAKAVEGQRWARAQQLGRYTVQVVGVRKRTSLAGFVEQHGIEDDTAIYRTENGGRYWYVLFHGIYETSEQAQAAVARLPAGMAADGPWVRRIPERGAVIPF